MCPECFMQVCSIAGNGGDEAFGPRRREGDKGTKREGRSMNHTRGIPTSRANCFVISRFVPSRTFVRS